LKNPWEIPQNPGIQLRAWNVTPALQFCKAGKRPFGRRMAGFLSARRRYPVSLPLPRGNNDKTVCLPYSAWLAIGFKAASAKLF
jgi:hypothetical protein